ncbi:C-type lectin domain family 4 member E-like isoform X3 [Echeneis naucrates]|uniref:C-type lectin domain family 4 member E-like isoform X3 n=1 Tax=Echeneis naucrates TaxID=173247 RepID=UPI00111404F6|nr:C-type lectin domain family 4 member E-like isoform X3 [Echeneis naucrates]
MTEADVVYSDIKFGKGKTNEITSSSADTTYSEVKISKTKDPAVLPVNRSTQTIQLLQKLQDEALKRNLTADRLCGTEPNNTLTLMCPKDPEVKRNETYPRCEEGWEHNGGKCYLFSTNGSSWEKSRDECKQLGGDLVKIDSREEQGFLAERLRVKMERAEDKFWIGLTDSKNEGDWLWVDGSPLDRNWTFWRSGEPDNWKEKDPDGEDCVAMGETGKIIESWTDGSCKTEYKSICEKEEEVGLYTITCV